MDTGSPVRFLNCGDCALSVELGSEISPAVNQQIKSLTDILSKKPIRGVSECIPAYCSLLIQYDPGTISGERLIRKLKKYLSASASFENKENRIFVIPVCYDGAFAPDMDSVCRHAKLTKEEVITIHSGRDYRIYMLGFLPGFPYLGGLDERLHTPRLASPRTAIPAGSVGIGGKQTGIYPLASPGGWQLIGRTPIKLYDPNREEPILYAAGDSIRFRPISEEDYREIKNQCDNGQYRCDRIQV